MTVADRIDVLRRDGMPVKTITNPAQILAALNFIKKYEAGWKDPLRGPLVPRLMLHFYHGNNGISGFGVGPGYIVSDPPTAGFWSRDAPQDEIDRLLQILGLTEIFVEL